MTHVHRIRLRGPWEVSALESTRGTSLPQSTKMPCPCSWHEGGWPGFMGRAKHVRRFGQPGQLDIHEHVWLVVDPCNGELIIELNGTRLSHVPKEAAFEWDITACIAPRNHLMIEVSGNDSTSGLTGEVRLEIRSGGDN